MTQNRSSAVMQQRREPHKSLDDFPTPPWATRALCEWLLERGALSPVTAGSRRLLTPGWQGVRICREPAANRGHMVRPLREYFSDVQASDIFDYGVGYPVADYLFGPDPAPVDWTITNPPFRLAEQFIARALRTSAVGVAMILRTAFLEGAGRYRSLFSATPPSHVLQFTERVVMHKGKLSPIALSASCWLIWMDDTARRTELHWIPPCRKRLEREGDYDG